jgi:multidrug resistance efflux pump
VEIIVTIAYVFLVRLVFFDYKLLSFNLFWKFVVFGLYAAAAMTEIIALGQFEPYSKEAFVEAYVIQLAPEFGGIVKEVHVKANEPIKQGEPLFSMDPSQWQSRLQESKAVYALARDEYQRLSKARRTGAVPQIQVDQARDDMDSAQAQLQEAQYNVDHATIVAPYDGYVVNLQLRAGEFIRLKVPVMDFVSSQARWVVGLVDQRASQWLDPGDEAEVAFDMYPGRVFPARVEHVVFATGQAQSPISGTLPRFSQFVPSQYYVVRLERVGDFPDHPLQFGSKALVAFYTGTGPQVFKLLRQLEIRSESYLNYVYNPF